MAVESHTLGPGQLTIGETGTERQFGAAAQAARLVPTAEEGDTITVLDGQETADEGKETWVLEGKVLQSYDIDSLIVWCADNSGKQMPFKYRPNNEQALQASGQLVVRSIAAGGDVKTRNSSDFTFKVIGKPAFAAATAPQGLMANDPDATLPEGFTANELN